MVLNLKFSTAITHNYATEYPSFSRILQATEEEEPEMSTQWREHLQHGTTRLVDENTLIVSRQKLDWYHKYSAIIEMNDAGV